ADRPSPASVAQRAFSRRGRQSRYARKPRITLAIPFALMLWREPAIGLATVRSSRSALTGESRDPAHRPLPSVPEPLSARAACAFGLDGARGCLAQSREGESQRRRPTSPVAHFE